MATVSEEIPAALQLDVAAALAWFHEQQTDEFEVTGILDADVALASAEPRELKLVLCGGDTCQQKTFRVASATHGFDVSEVDGAAAPSARSWRNPGSTPQEARMSEANDWKPGGCLCGKVGYAIDRAGVVGQAHCQCRDCQRATGSAFATFCFVPDASFRADRGEPKAFTVTGSSGGDVIRFFCADCGSQLYSEVATMPGLKFVKSGSLDDAGWMEPQTAFWCDTAQPWAALPDGVSKHARTPS